jgi:hypothetical protein
MNIEKQHIFQISQDSASYYSSGGGLEWKMLTSPSCCFQLDFAPRLLVIGISKASLGMSVLAYSAYTKFKIINHLPVLNTNSALGTREEMLR